VDLHNQQLYQYWMHLPTIVKSSPLNISTSSSWYLIIGLYKPFQFLWRLKSGCFKAHLQNLKTNTFTKSRYPKSTKMSLEMLGRSVFKILSSPMSRDLTSTIALDSIGLSETKSITYSTLSIMTWYFRGHKIHWCFYFTIWSQSLLWQLQLYKNAHLI